MKDGRRFVVERYFLGFDHIQLGFHVCLSLPNVELHVPFGFVRIGWINVPACDSCAHEQECSPWITPGLGELWEARKRATHGRVELCMGKESKAWPHKRRECALWESDPC